MLELETRVALPQANQSFKAKQLLSHEVIVYLADQSFANAESIIWLYMF